MSTIEVREHPRRGTRGAGRRPGRPTVVRKHQRITRFPKIAGTSNFGLISAETPGLLPLESHERYVRLEEDLRRMGYHPVPAEGVYEGQRERAFLVPDLMRDDALQLGRRYGQRSVIADRQLIDTGGHVLGRFRANETLYGRDAEESPFHTVVPRDPATGRRIAFALRGGD